MKSCSKAEQFTTSACYIAIKATRPAGAAVRLPGGRVQIRNAHTRTRPSQGRGGQVRELVVFDGPRYLDPNLNLDLAAMFQIERVLLPNAARERRRHVHSAHRRKRRMLCRLRAFITQVVCAADVQKQPGAIRYGERQREAHGDMAHARLSGSVLIHTVSCSSPKSTAYPRSQPHHSAYRVRSDDPNRYVMLSVCTRPGSWDAGEDHLRQKVGQRVLVDHVHDPKALTMRSRPIYVEAFVNKHSQ